jgi:hypothetical protein
VKVVYSVFFGEVEIVLAVDSVCIIRTTVVEIGIVPAVVLARQLLPIGAQEVMV